MEAISLCRTFLLQPLNFYCTTGAMTAARTGPIPQQTTARNGRQMATPPTAPVTQRSALPTATPARQQTAVRNTQGATAANPARSTALPMATSPATARSSVGIVSDAFSTSTSTANPVVQSSQGQANQPVYGKLERKGKSQFQKKEIIYGGTRRMGLFIIFAKFILRTIPNG